MPSSKSDPIITLRFNSEKVPGKGEDADPILLPVADKGLLLGVFDGMGGAGSTVYTIDGNNHTGAYIAARLVSAEVRAFFSETIAPSLDGFDPKRASSDLHERLRTALTQAVTSIHGANGAATSSLRSRLFKRLPTTAALLYVETTPHGNNGIRGHAVWAGDSRCYLLSPDHGLQQLTADDTHLGGDALESLRNDAPISNCVNADTDFQLHFRSVQLLHSCIVLCVTDGCFGYVPTPAYVEYLMLRSLRSAPNAESWRDQMRKEFSDLAGDDASLALACLGYRNFKEMKAQYAPRLDRLNREMIAPLNQARSDLVAVTLTCEETTQKKEACQTQLESIRQTTWDAYKITYSEYLMADIPHSSGVGGMNAIDTSDGQVPSGSPAGICQ